MKPIKLIFSWRGLVLLIIIIIGSFIINDIKLVNEIVPGDISKVAYRNYYTKENNLLLDFETESKGAMYLLESDNSERRMFTYQLEEFNYLLIFRDNLEEYKIYQMKDRLYIETLNRFVYLDKSSND